MKSDICDYGPWIRLADMVDSLGSVQLLDRRVRAGTVEVREVMGAGSAIVLARWVKRRDPGKIDAGYWTPIHDMAAHLGCTVRTITNRVAQGTMQRKFIGNRSFVRVSHAID